LVDLMMQQQPEQRMQSVAKVKQELIGRGNNFVNLQRLDTLKKQVVPESEISDTILADPIRVALSASQASPADIACCRLVPRVPWYALALLPPAM
jgi:hypothetical protein